MNKTINIQTAHNIVVSFELASVLQRISAWLIDAAIILVYIIIVAALFSSSNILSFLLIFPVVTFFDLFFEIYNKGQSPGKMLFKIRVVTLKGATPDVIDYFKRWIFRILDIGGTFGMLAIIFTSSTKKNQRIGDIIAQTSVVKLKNDAAISLESITNIQSDKEIQYQAIAQYTDEDMLLIKQSIIRYKQFPNEANKNVLKTLCMKVEERLDVKIEQKNKLKFLEQVLYEYIILTR